MRFVDSGGSGATDVTASKRDAGDKQHRSRPAFLVGRIIASLYAFNTQTSVSDPDFSSCTSLEQILSVPGGKGPAEQLY